MIEEGAAQNSVAQNILVATFWFSGISAIWFSCYVADIESKTKDPHQCCGAHYPGTATMPRCPFMDPEPYTKNFLEWRSMRYARIKRCRQLGCAHKSGCEHVQAVAEWLPPIGCEHYTEIRPNWWRSPDGNHETQGRKNPEFKRRAYGTRNAGYTYSRPKPAAQSEPRKTTIRKRAVIE